MTDQPIDAHRTETVRLAVYTGFALTGRAPGLHELAAGSGITPAQARQALQALHRSRDVVLNAPDGDHIVMAHPFSSVPLGFSVMGARTLWWGGCAWDSFAIAHLLPDEPEVLVATRCPACRAPHAWSVGAGAPPPGDQVAHFATPVCRIWDDVVQSCANQRLFCSEECVGDWLAATCQPRGYSMDLATLWRLARGWYTGRLQRGYTRREPSAAASYFAGAGLHGSFWGLPADRPPAAV